ncbi:hypothetical protein [Pseudogulbenkiania sp. MAI-1]|uniref:hypothetical protein n=1 Tax=Pseudogulbenkiania sp. MAI-1 TaxID=990370 RepID=UPI00045E8995|nr:hypothetical protein [Pseudogulbenkiania sp. MAI-1]
MSNDHYTYRITWSPEDEEYVGLCEEFPSLSWLASTQQEAFNGIVRLVKDVVKDLKEHGERVPEPVAEHCQ